MHEGHELNIVYDSTECFDNRVSLSSIEECGIKDYKPMLIGNDDVEPPVNFRKLSVHTTSNEILHPGAIFLKFIIKIAHIHVLYIYTQ